LAICLGKIAPNGTNQTMRICKQATINTAARAIKDDQLSKKYRMFN